MKSYYFIGILGSGMSALARLAHQMGHAVGGSDRNLSGGAYAEFKSIGIKVYAQDGAGIETFAAALKIDAREIIIVKSTAGFARFTAPICSPSFSTARNAP